MLAGIIGYPTSGKTTLFEAICEHHSADIGTVFVPDERFDYIVNVTKPKKVSPNHVEFQDNAARIEPGEHKAFSNEFFAGARKVEVLVHVVRAFESPYAPYYAEIDPLRDHRKIEQELILADLQVIENRMERLQKLHTTHQSGSPEQNEWRILEKLRAEVENEKPIRQVDLGVEEKQRIRGFQFLSEKPMVCVANINESEAASGENIESLQPLKVYCDARDIPLVALSAEIEKEIGELDDADHDAFIADLGIASPANHRMIRAVYDALGLITFFTVSSDEARAWAIEHSAKALDAAAKIHSDLARGFIRAEVTSFEHLKEFGGLDPAVKAGKMRLEGKEYTVHDGDVVHIRFKV